MIDDMPGVGCCRPLALACAFAGRSNMPCTIANRSPRTGIFFELMCAIYSTSAYLGGQSGVRGDLSIKFRR
eukprot:73176-Pyramimonas_sp.AAC.1